MIVYTIGHESKLLETAPQGKMWRSITVEDTPINNWRSHSSFAEMRAHAIVAGFRNYGDDDLVGFQHYRRYLMLGMFEDLGGEVSYHLRKMFNASLSSTYVDMAYKDFLTLGREMSGYRDIEDWANDKHVDMILPRPHPWNVRDQYVLHHDPESWDTLVDIVKQSPEYQARGDYFAFNLMGFYACNMFVLRGDLFNQYMQFWGNVMAKFARKFPGPFKQGQERLYGFISERLFSVWVNYIRNKYPNLLVVEVPHVFCSRWGK